MIKEGIVKQGEGKEWKNQVKHRNKRWNGDSKLDWDYRISASKTMKSYLEFYKFIVSDIQVIQNAEWKSLIS